MAERSEGGSTGVRESLAADDPAAFNKGKGRVLAAMVGALIAAVAAFGWYVAQGKESPYAALGKQVNGLRTQYFDGFLVCALPGKKASEIKNDGELRDELHGRGAAGARYAAHLRNACSAPLRELDIRLQALAPPAEATPALQGMAAGVTKMRVGTEAYIAHLEGLTGGYDRAAAEPELAPLVRGWYEFRKAHGEFNRLVKEQLGR